MNVIIHYPEGMDQKDAVSRRASEIYAEAVTEYLKNLSCPDAQKLELLDRLRNSPPSPRP